MRRRQKFIVKNIAGKIMTPTTMRLCSIAGPAVLLAIASLLPARASAGCVGGLGKPEFPTISVIGNSVEYVEVEDSGYVWSVPLDIKCGTWGRVKSWFLWPTIQVESIGTLTLVQYEASKTYHWGARPKQVHWDDGVIILSAYAGAFAVEACNANAERLRQAGQSARTIFAAEHRIPLTFWVWGDFDYTFRPIEFDSVMDLVSEAHLSEIVCRKWEGPQVPGPGGIGAETEFELLSAALIISPRRYEGACPKDMLLVVRLEANLNGPVEVRIESTDGWKSEKGVMHTLAFNEGTGRWRGQESESLAVPVLLPAKPHSDAVVPPSPAGGFVPPRDDDGTDPGPDWTPALTGAEPGGNVHAESLRLIASAGGRTLVSEWQDYRYTCDPETAIGGPGDLNPPAGPEPG